MDALNYNSVELIPGSQAQAAFVSKGTSVYRETDTVAPIVIDDTLSYMPWGADNQMPYDVLSLIESDETMSTCQMFNSEVCYGAGLRYNTDACAPAVVGEVSDFMLDNDMPNYFLGVCQDLKYYAFAVSVIIISRDGSRIVRLMRKEACYCRFAPADKRGKIRQVLYANWRKSPSSRKDIEVIELLDPSSPWSDLHRRLETSTVRKFAVLSRVPSADNPYYPIPYYASLFKGKWYNIKTLIGIAKESKLRNSAPLKYQIEISAKYWENIFRSEGITDRVKQKERIVKEKQQILDFLTGAENSGKAWFSTFYISPNGEEQHDVKITKIDGSKEGGDWESDIQEAVNMICFTMRVHSNLVGSVPGKSQSNNSGSDKRELYTIAQALQKPYHDILFTVHRLIIRYNGWSGAYPETPFVMLTTLDKGTDAKVVNIND